MALGEPMAGNSFPRKSGNDGNSRDVLHVTPITASAGEVRVLVFSTSNRGLFDLLVDEVHGIMAAHWMARTSTEIPVSETDFRDYVYLAARTRLARVNLERNHLRCDDQWVLPTLLANVINSVGLIRGENPVHTVVPVWPIGKTLVTSFEIEDNVQRRAFHARVARQMAVVATTLQTISGVPMTFVRNLESDRNGDPHVMLLVPVFELPTDEVESGIITPTVREAPAVIASVVADADTGEPTVERLHSRGEFPVDGVSALQFLAWGLFPEVYRDLNTLTHPLLIPGSPRFITTASISSTWRRLTEKAS
jgi:hypothetical protein